MKKYYYLIALLLLSVTLVGCNKTEEVVVVEPTINIEELTFEEPVEIVEDVEFCETVLIPAYRWDFDMSQYPVVVNPKFSYAKITAKFSDDFINNYRYEDSDQFYFGLKVFVWDHTDNGWYYNVLRTRSLSIANWNYLTGAIMANQLKEWFTWTVPLFDDVYVANSEFVEWLQFMKFNFGDYISQDWDTKIWAYLSSVKELKWWELWDISIELCM